MTTRHDVAAERWWRIEAEHAHFGGCMPEQTALSWRGYLAAMLEWNLIAVEQYQALGARLPPVADDPAVAILRGRDGLSRISR